MKSVTEFPTHKLVSGIESKTALLAEGKSPEDIEQSLGETFKLEGEKLKFFMNSMDVAAENREKLTRIRVLILDESESLPEKAVKVEDHVYLPEFGKGAPSTDPKKFVKKTSQNKGKRKDGPKSSPWGITPEEAAAKKAGAKDKSKPAQ